MKERDMPADVLQRWQRLRATGVSAHALIDFHAAHKYLVMAHSVTAYRAAGRLLADLSGANLDPVADAYIAVVARALASPASREGHVNVLQHVAGYFRGRVAVGERQRLHAAIADYEAGRLALQEVIAMINHLLVDHPDEYLARQVYLQQSSSGAGRHD